RARAGRGVAVPRLGMGLRPRGPADRDVGRLAVPPLGVEEPGQPHDEHGHPGVTGHHRRLRLGGGDRGLRVSGPDAWLGFGLVPDGADALYLDVAAGVTTFQLAGRYFETRSRRKAGDLLAALSDLAPKTARVRGEN